MQNPTTGPPITPSIRNADPRDSQGRFEDQGVIGLLPGVHEFAPGGSITIASDGTCSIKDRTFRSS
jgi:hypothetical protein